MCVSKFNKKLNDNIFSNNVFNAAFSKFSILSSVIMFAMLSSIKLSSMLN